MKKIFLSLFIPVMVCVQTSKESINLSAEIESTNTPKVGSLSKEDAKLLIEIYRARVLKGESMSKLAKEYSQDPGSAKNGGLYKNVARGVMVSEFENAAFKLKAGEVSEVFETQYGFHFVQLLQHRGDVVDLRHILIIPN